MKKSTNASTEAQLITPAALTDEQRGLIERAEDRLCGRGAEDADAANGLLEVLIAHPARPIAHDEAAQPEKSCADALTGIAQFLTDVVTAAGLLSHGRTDKKLATRITEQADELRTHMHLLAASPVEQPAAAPIDHISQAGKMVGAAAPADEPTIPTELHPDTAKLVRRFARALANKLLAAQRKYGYSDNWMRDDWADECRAELMRHIQKGDPRDVAAYCAFLWHHSESTAPAQPAPSPVDEREGLTDEQRSDIHAAIRAITDYTEEIKASYVTVSGTWCDSSEEQVYESYVALLERLRALLQGANQS